MPHKYGFLFYNTPIGMPFLARVKGDPLLGPPVLLVLLVLPGDSQVDRRTDQVDDATSCVASLAQLGRFRFFNQPNHGNLAEDCEFFFLYLIHCKGKLLEYDHVFFNILRDDCKENPDEDGLRSVAVKQQRIVDFTPILIGR